MQREAERARRAAACEGASDDEDDGDSDYVDDEAELDPRGGLGDGSSSEAVTVRNNNTAGLYLGLLQQIFGYYDVRNTRHVNNFNVNVNKTIIEVPSNQTPAINKKLDTVMTSANIVGFPGPNMFLRDEPYKVERHQDGSVLLQTLSENEDEYIKIIETLGLRR